jgi:aspartyl-tRNA(Asn)/glutamyl-tRNA(Gln) amidotransferase subunit B
MQAYVEKIRSSMPELPDATRKRLLARGLTAWDTNVLMTADAGREVGMDGAFGKGGVVAYFDALSENRDPKIVVNWIVQVLFGQLASRNQTFTENPITVAQLGSLIDMVQSGVITGERPLRSEPRPCVTYPSLTDRFLREVDRETHVG